jgi:hypothetical protein
LFLLYEQYCLVSQALQSAINGAVDIELVAASRTIHRLLWLSGNVTVFLAVVEKEHSDFRGPDFLQAPPCEQCAGIGKLKWLAGFLQSFLVAS